jgi:hypothetical protein
VTTAPDAPRPSSEHPAVRGAAWAVLVVVAAYFCTLCFTQPWFGDGRRYLAGLHEIHRHPFAPGHECARAACTDSPLFTPYLMAVGWGSLLTGVTPYRALQVAGCVNVLLYLAAVVAFFRHFCGAARGPVAAAAFTLVTLFARTHVDIWSSDTNYRSLAEIQAYPSLLGWTVVLASVAATDGYLRGARGSAALAAVAASVPLLLLTHALSSAWQVVAVAAVTGAHVLGFAGSGPPDGAAAGPSPDAGPDAVRRRAARLVCACAAAAAVAFAWPWVRIAGHASYGMVNEFEGQRPYTSLHPVLAFAFVYAAAVPLAVRAVRRREHGVWIAVGVATAAAFGVVRLAGVVYGDRFALFAAFVPQALVAAGCAEALDSLAAARRARGGLPAGPRTMGPVAAAALLGCAAAGVAVGLARGPAPAKPWLPPGETPPERAYYARVEPLSEHLGPDDVVAIPLSVWSWDVAAVTGARSIVGNYDHLLPDFERRKADLATILSPSSPDDARRDAISRRGVTSVLLVNADAATVAATARWAGEPVHAARRFTLFRLR